MGRGIGSPFGSHIAGGKIVENVTVKAKKLRGFAVMSPEKRREIAAKGGKAVKAENRSFSKNRALAAKAGSIGGKSVPAEKRQFSKDKDLAKRASLLPRKNSRVKPDAE